MSEPIRPSFREGASLLARELEFAGAMLNLEYWIDKAMESPLSETPQITAQIRGASAKLRELDPEHAEFVLREFSGCVREAFLSTISEIGKVMASISNAVFTSLSDEEREA